MKNGRNYWAEHVAAIKSQGVTASTYARQHGISVTALYYWQRKLQLEMAAHSMALAAPKPQGKFVALRMNDALEQLQGDDPEKARIVVLKFFGGLTNQEVATSLDANGSCNV